MEDPKSIPAVKFTSCHLYSKGSKENNGNDKVPVATSTAVLGCGAVIHPFHHYDSNNENVSYRTPILCLFCGGFLSIHALINPKTGEWCCPLCRHTNPMFHNLQNNTNSVSKVVAADLNYDQYLREIYPELQSKHVDYHEVLGDMDMTQSAFCDKHNPLLTPLHVFAIDRNLLHVVTSIDEETDTLFYDDSAIEMLIEGLQQLTPFTRVCILLYDSVIHLLRLSSIDTDPVVTMDALPGNSNGTGADCNSLLHFTRRGLYYNTADVLLTHVNSLKASLCNMALSKVSSMYEAVNASNTSSSGSIYCKCSINTLVQTALSMHGIYIPIQNTRGKVKTPPSSSDKIDMVNNNFTRLIFVTSRLLPISMSNPITARVHSASSLLLSGPDGDVGGTNNDSKLPKLVASYLDIGKYAYTNNMSIDVFYQTKHHDYSQVIDKFQALVCPSGGSFLRVDTLKDSALKQSFCALMRYNQLPEQQVTNEDTLKDTEETYKYVRDCRASNMATIQIRTSGELSVNQIVGHVQPTDDVIYYRNGACIADKDDKIMSSTQICVDIDQLTDTLQVLDSQNTPDVFTSSNPIHKKVSGYAENANIENKDETKFFSNRCDALYYRLMQSHVDTNTVVSGVPSTSLQYNPNSMLSITFDITPESERRVRFSSRQAVQQLLGTTAAKIIASNPLSHGSGGSDLPLYATDVPPTGNSPASQTSSQQVSNNVYDSYGTTSAEKESYLNGVFVQFVIHYNQFNLSGGPSATNKATVASVSKVTRVYTVRIEKTNDFEEFLEGFDETLYGLVASRSIVADYHNTCMSSFSGVRKHKLDEQDHASGEVDKLVKHVCSLMRSSPKALTVCRMLHHLKEGPLLDGPSMQPVDAYLLRTLFLNAPYFYSLRILMPSVRLVCLPDSVRDNSETNAATATASVPAPPPPLTTLYPPPSLVPPSAPPLAGHVVASPPLVVTPLSHPPPPGPPPSNVSTVPPTQAPLSLYLPPNSPHPSAFSSTENSIHGNSSNIAGTTTNSAEVTVSVSYSGIAATIDGDVGTPNEQSNSVLLYSVLPDSMSLLPNTVALIDYGDVVIIRVNSPSDLSKNDGDNNDDFKEVHLQSVISQLTVIADKIASSRFPVASVHRINARYSPLDRLVFSRLSPNHMDTMNNLLCMYGTDPASVMHSFLPGFKGLTEEELDHMILHSPITDQLYLSKYLFAVSPQLAGGMLKNLLAETTIGSGAGDNVVKNNRVDSQKVTVTKPVKKGLSTPLQDTPPVTGSMDRDGDQPTSSLEQVDLSMEDNKNLSPVYRHRDKSEDDSTPRNSTTVWGDISSIFGSINPFGSKGHHVIQSDEDSIDVNDKA